MTPFQLLVGCLGPPEAPAPTSTTGPSPDTAREELCDNGADDDADGLVDCADVDCLGQCPESCGNALDDDGNGLVDCADDRDNDGDGEFDCEDPDCSCMLGLEEAAGSLSDNIIRTYTRFSATGGDLDGDGLHDLAMPMQIDTRIAHPARADLTDQDYIAIVTLEGVALGLSASVVPDPDGDGLDGLVVSPATGDAGWVGVWYSAPLHDVDAEPDETWHGVVPDADFGTMQGRVGDVDDDGVMDVGAGRRFPGYAPYWYDDEDPAVWLIAPGLNPGVHSVDEAPVAVWTAAGYTIMEMFPNLGDFNGDGVDDLLIGGVVPVDGGTLTSEIGGFLWPGPVATELHTGDATLTFYAGLGGGVEDGQWLDAGDLDGDGLSDLAMGIENADVGNVNGGALCIIPGGSRRDFVEVLTTYECAFGDEFYGNLGDDVEIAVLTEPGALPHVLVTSPASSVSGVYAAGALFAIPGSFSGFTDPVLAADWIVVGNGVDTPWDGLVADDWDGDGLDDIGLISSSANPPWEGSILFFFGSDL